jgi:hypothetical protein
VGAFSNLLIYTASRVYEHCAQISQMSAYDIIRFQLVELMQEPEAIRLNMTAAAYIKSRTYLSRSGIMRILAELRTGKYITMERGVLMISTTAESTDLIYVWRSGDKSDTIISPVFFRFQTMSSTKTSRFSLRTGTDSHLEPYCTTRRTGRGEQLIFRLMVRECVI